MKYLKNNLVIHVYPKTEITLTSIFQVNLEGFVCQIIQGKPRVYLVDLGNSREIAWIGIAHSPSPSSPSPMSSSYSATGKGSDDDGEINYKYASPEFTGRTGNTVDHRSDIYSLGILLFELACGYPPFAALDPIELVHLHMSQKVPRINPAASWQETDAAAVEVINAIIQKMLSKSPKDRYQSCYGILRDFEALRDTWREKHQNVVFEIAKHDMEDRFLISEDKLYGREREFSDLVRFLESFCTTNESGVLLVGGHPGVGKSSLIRNIFSHVSSQQYGKVPILLSGKHDQIKHTPYSAIIEVIFAQFNDLPLFISTAFPLYFNLI